MFVSPYAKVGGLVWFACMVQKIRLRADGKLPEDYQDYMGRGFDGRCVRFLGIGYDSLIERVYEGGTDDELLKWSFDEGRRPSQEAILVWNEFVIKRGWRDSDSPDNELQEYKEHYGLGHRDDVLTYFDFFEVDEGRKP